MRIADTHSHLYFPVFDPDRAAVLKQNREKGVALQIQIGCNQASSEQALKLAQENLDVFCVLGIHPCDADKVGDLEQTLKYFEKLATENPDKVVGFGETGLDLYHRDTPDLLAAQKASLHGHLELCKKFNKPIVLHTRNSAQKTLDELESFGDLSFGGVWHCFCEDGSVAQQVLDRGLYLGVGGILTYPNAEKTRDAIKRAPLSRIVTETDAPFLVPQSRRKETKRNESYFLEEVIELIADIKGEKLERVEQALWDNAHALFKLTQ